MYVIDLEGNEYPTMCTTKERIHLSSSHTIDILFERNGPNDIFMDNLDKLWTFVDNKGTEFVLLHHSRTGKGSSNTLTAKGIPLFYDVLKSDKIYEEHTGSMTFDRACSLVFDNLPFSYIVHDQFNAIEWEGFGAGEYKINTFKRILNRYGAEFEIVGRNVHLKKMTGIDTNILYAHKLNVSDLQIDVDASEFYTYAKGYGDYGEETEGDLTDWKDAKLVEEYVSPLESIIGRRRHADPIKDGRITDPKKMRDDLKKIVDDSLKISITLTMHRLSTQGYSDYIPNMGDRVWVQDGRVDVNDEVRVQEMDIVKNWKGEVLDYQIVVGSPSTVKRYKSQLSGAVQSMNDLLDGKTKLPYSVLDNAVINATKALQNAQSELYFPESGGILAVNKTNPNLVTYFTSSGIGVSKDGGSTFTNAITGEGIVAEAIMAGVVKGLILEGSEILGGKFVTTGGSSRMEIEQGIIKMYSDGRLTSSIDASGQDFYRDGYRIGRIGTSSWFGKPNYKGLSTQLDTDASYIHWGYRKNPGDDSFTTMMSWHKTDEVMPKGLNFSDIVTVHDDLNISKGIINLGGGAYVERSSNIVKIGFFKPGTTSYGSYLTIQNNGMLVFWHNGNSKLLAEL